MIDIPDELAAAQCRHNGARGRAWIATLPRQAAEYLQRWELRRDGPTRHGMTALVLPVVRSDGTPAALKLQPVDEETTGEALALRTWGGAGAVRVLEHDPSTGTMLLERLDADRPLSALPDDDTAVATLADLLARLVTVPAPPELRRLGHIAAAMLDQVPAEAAALPDPDQRRLLRTCASAVAEQLGEAGDRLLHWDLHYDNILAGHREPWLAIDPKPLAGDPGYELLPALTNRWDDAVATGNPARATLRRFDHLTSTLDIDRGRASGWTLGRVLENALWDIADGEHSIDPAQSLIATTLIQHRR